MREFPCRLIRVINGNTVEAVFDLGFGIFTTKNIRLFGVDQSDKAMTALIKAMPREFLCQITYSKRGKEGRVLGQVFKDDQEDRININDMMIDQGFALKKN